MREHLEVCEACRRRYRRHLLLAELDPAALPAKERIARGLGLSWRKPEAFPIPASVLTLAAAAAVLLFFVQRGPSMSGFSVRGLVQSPPASRVLVYDVRPDAAPALAGDTVGRSDELAFAYENGAAKPRLMIFGVDEHSHVYWFFPAWTNEAEDPTAIAIETDPGRHELPEAIRHRLDGSRLDVRALFLEAPLSVRQVETLIRERPSGPLPIAGAVQSSVSFAVTP